MNIYGIDIGAAGARIARVEKKLRGYSVKRLKAVPAGGDLSTALKAALKEMEFDPMDDIVAAVFPKDRVSIRVLTMALEDGKKIAEALPFEIESLVPFDAESMVIAHQLARMEKGETRVCATFAPKTEFERFLEILGAAGVDPDYVVPAPFAVTAAIAGDDPADALMVDIGSASVMILAARGGVVALAHASDMGASALADGLAGAEGADETQTRLSSFAGRLAREIKLVMASASREGGPFQPPKISLCGGPAADLKLQNLLAERLGAPVERASVEGDDAPRDLDGQRDRRGARTIFASALGAALIAARDPDTRMNFRTGAHKKSGGLAGAGRQTILTAALAVVFVFAWIGAHIAEGMRLDGKYGAIKNELRVEFKKAMPEVSNIVSEIAQLKGALAALESRAAALGPAMAEKDTFLDLFTGVTDSVPQGARLDITELTYEWDRMLLSGRTDSFERVEQFRENLEKLEWAGKAVVEGAKTGLAGGGVEFKMTLNVAR